MTPIFNYKKILIAIALIPTYSNAEDWFASNGKYLTGDWQGYRTEFTQMGYDFSVDYSSIVTSNISGGYDRDKTARYSDQYTFGAKLDLEKLAGISDAQFVVSINDRNGRDITVDRIQDSRAPVIGSGAQSNYGRGQTWHIGQLWYQQKIFNNFLDFKIGRMAIGEDFDNNGCFFQNLSLCGSLAGHGSGVWYNTPVSQYGTRIKINFDKSNYAQFGAFLYNPSYLTREGSFKMNLSGRTGNMYVAELGHLFSLGDKKLPGSLKLGGWYNTVNAADVLNDSDGNVYIVSKSPAKIHDGRYGGYFYLMQQVSDVGNDISRGLTLFIHLSANDKYTSTMDYQAQVGAVYKGLFASRPIDYISFGLNKMHVNQRLAQRADIANNLKGLNDYDNPAYQPVRSTEYAAELRYSAKITPWFSISPDIQLIANPGGVNVIKDAWVFGTQVNLSF